MTLGYHFLFSNWIEKNGTEDNNNDLSDSGKPNLNSRFRGPTLGVHLRVLPTTVICGHRRLACREKRSEAHRDRFGRRRETRREAVAVLAANRIVEYLQQARQNRDTLLAVITHLLA